MATPKTSRSKPAESSLISEDLKKKLPANTYTGKKKTDEIVKPKIKRRQITKAPPKIRKKPRWRKFIEAFIGDEDPTNLQEYIMFDIIIPAVKSTINEAITGGLEMLLFGDRRSGRGNVYRDRKSSYVNYGGASYNRSRDDGRGYNRRSTRAAHDFDDIVFESRDEAENVLSHLADLIMDYGSATVGDFYDLCGIDSQFTDGRYGWKSLRESRVDRVRNGYVVILPRTIEIED